MKVFDLMWLVIFNDGWEYIESDIWGVYDYVVFGSLLVECYV